MELLNNQMEARNVLALNIIEEAKESLELLGLEDMLNTNKVATTEVKTVEIIKEVSSDTDRKEIARLTKELKDAIELNNQHEEINATLRKEIEALKATIKTQAETVITVDDNAIEELNKQLAIKDSIIEELNNKIQLLEAKDKKSNAKVHVEQKVNVELPEDLKITKNFDTHIIGSYKGVAFEAMKTVEGTNVYDPTKWELKDEINSLLSTRGLIHADREIKD